MSLRVHPEALSGASASVGALARGVAQKAASGMESSGAAADGNPGFRTSDALRTCAAAWQGRLQRLASGLDATAGALGQTADNYVQTESALAGNFHHLADQLLQGRG